MKDLKLVIARIPVLGRLLLMGGRAWVALRYMRQTPWCLIKWLFKSREITNFTYHLEARNKKHLAALLAHVLAVDSEVITAYMQELEENSALREHLMHATAHSELACIADREVRYARRLGWYVFVRVTKPRVVIETGVDKGLGACVLTAALEKNDQEGFRGHYFGTDINPRAGYLLSGRYRAYGTILYGDSIESLKGFDQEIDLFINDSDHSSTYEAEEYAVVAPKLSQNAYILGDNAHASDALFEFAAQTARQFVFFQENPAQHWYPGGGIGICFKKTPAPCLQASDAIIQPGA